MNKKIQNLAKILIPIAFLLVGISIFCYPMILNSDNMPGEMVDARFINYILEHQFLFINQTYPHTSFWDMPMYYPLKNTLALSDILLGISPIYILFRFFIDNPQTNLQIVFVILNILNFIAFYIFAKKIFKLNILYSSFAAFIFAFNLPRYSQIFHIQLFAQFYMILSLLFFCLIKSTNSKKKNKLYFFLGLLFFIIQAYTAFYYAWFYAFSLLFLTISFFLSKKLKEKLLNWLKCFDKSYFVIFLSNILLLIPLIVKYLSIGEHFKKHDSISILNFFTSQSYLDWVFIDLSQYTYIDHTIGIGFITTIVLLISILKSEYKLSICFFIIALSLCFIQNNINDFLYDNLFFMKAIRGYGRYIFILIPIYALLISGFLQKQKNLILTLTIITLMICEHIPYSSNYTWTKTQHQKEINAINFDKSCKVVGLITPDYKDYLNSAVYDMNTMWWALNKRVYSLNGYAAIYYDISKKDAEAKCILKMKE